jgi:hypothetical protein
VYFVELSPTRVCVCKYTTSYEGSGSIINARGVFSNIEVRVVSLGEKSTPFVRRAPLVIWLELSPEFPLFLTISFFGLDDDLQSIIPLSPVVYLGTCESASCHQNAVRPQINTPSCCRSNPSLALTPGGPFSFLTFP